MTVGDIMAHYDRLRNTGTEVCGGSFTLAGLLEITEEVFCTCFIAMSHVILISPDLVHVLRMK